MEEIDIVLESTLTSCTKLITNNSNLIPEIPVIDIADNSNSPEESTEDIRPINYLENIPYCNFSQSNTVQVDDTNTKNRNISAPSVEDYGNNSIVDVEVIDGIPIIKVQNNILSESNAEIQPIIPIDSNLCAASKIGISPKPEHNIKIMPTLKRKYKLIQKSPDYQSSVNRVSPTLKKITKKNRRKVKPRTLKCIKSKILPVRKKVLQPKPVMNDLPDANSHSSNVDKLQEEEQHLVAFLKASSTIEKPSDKKTSKRKTGTRLNKRLKDKLKYFSYKADLQSQEEKLVINYVINVQNALKSIDESKFREFVNTIKMFSILKETPVQLYYKICQILIGLDDLKEEFVIFLTPDQAIEVGKYPEYCMFRTMRKFIDESKYMIEKGAKQQMQKMVNLLQSLLMKPNVTDKELIDSFKPILQDQPQLIECLTQILPTSQPTKSFSEDFEEIDLDNQDSSDGMEHIRLVDNNVPALDEQCNCECHSKYETNSKTEDQHCVSCGLRFIDGRTYFKYNKMLRLVKVTRQNTDSKVPVETASVGENGNSKPTKQSRTKSESNENKFTKKLKKRKAEKISK